MDSPWTSASASPSTPSLDSQDDSADGIRRRARPAGARSVSAEALHPKITGWRDALRRVQCDATPEQWRRLRTEALHLGCPASVWSSLYAHTILQRGVFQAALLAVLEEPPQLRDAALADIARTARAAFAPPPPSPARSIGDFEHRLALRDAAASPADAVELCIAIAGAYADMSDSPSIDDADRSLDAARSAARRRDRPARTTHIAHAAACAMRGAPMWDGWLREGPEDFQAACIMIVSCLDWLKMMHRAPLPAATAAQSSLAALCADVEDRYGERRRANGEANGIAPLPLEQLLADVATLAGSGALPPDHPAHHDPQARLRLGEGLIALCHTRAEYEVFGALDHTADSDAVHAAMSQLEADCVASLGRLRLGTPEALHTLLHRAVDSDLHPAINEAAVWALQEIGAPSLPLLRATLRYASDPYVRKQALLAFGGAARGIPAAFDELVDLFRTTPWRAERRDYALALALTADPRAIDALVTALHDSPPTTEDVAALLDALDHVPVAWRWLPEIHGIALPDGVRIADLPGLDHPPLQPRR